MFLEETQMYAASSGITPFQPMRTSKPVPFSACPLMMTPVQLLDFQKLQIILSHFGSFFCNFMRQEQLFQGVLCQLSHTFA
jgi:predicted TIM-barrel fold metal-dependent hydrolase